MPKYIHNWRSNLSKIGCTCVKCTIRQIYSRSAKGISMVLRDSRGRFVRSVSTVEQGLGFTMVKAFAFHDLKALFKAVKAQSDTVETQCNYLAYSLKELQRPGKYTFDTLVVLRKFTEYWHEKAVAYNEELKRNRHKIDGGKHADKIFLASEEYAFDTYSHMFRIRMLPRCARPIWHGGGGNYIVNRILAITKLNTDRQIRDRMMIQWSEFYKAYMYTFKDTTYTEDHGYVKNKDLNMFYRCENPHQTCSNWNSTGSIQRWIDDDDGHTYRVCRRCIRNLPRATNVIAAYNADPLHVIRSSSGTPFRWLPNEKVSDKTLYLGVELEVVWNKLSLEKYGSDIQKLARVFNKFLNKDRQMAIVKHDGSINDHGNINVQGFEIVSLPGTHAWHMQGWNEFFDKEKGISKYVSGWNHLSCGMHVHVSRGALETVQMGKLIVFVNDKDNLKFIEDVAGRGSTRYSQLLHKHLKATTDALINGVPVPNMNTESHYKYNAIRLDTGKPTIEFRIFRSNVAKNGFLKNIDFCAAACAWAAVTSNRDLGYKSFIKYVDENRSSYKYLARWLVHKKYIEEKHKFKPEFQSSDDLVFEDS